jgi:hypothetical protein
MLSIYERSCPHCNNWDLTEFTEPGTGRICIECPRCAQCFGESSADGTLLEALAELDTSFFHEVGAAPEVDLAAYARRLRELQAFKAATL